jgi:aminoglycoside phosphotransferase (APT) family kinase protein
MSRAMHRELGPPIAAGNEAELFAWGDKVLKLSKRPGDPSQAEHEAAVLRAVAPFGLGPALVSVIEVEGRWGLVMERIEAPTLASTLGDPGLIGELLELMVTLHRRIHAVTAPADLPDLKQRLATRIGRAERLPQTVRDDLQARLAAMPADDRLCHGDFHPFNILGLDANARVIDWLDASRGVPAADVCRTYVLAGAYYPELARSYREAYLDAAGLKQADVDAWLPFVAAARLCENVPAEFDRLAELAQGRALG